MLKIKDEVDLSVLEKFGFEHFEDLDDYCYVHHSNFNGVDHIYFMLSVRKDREIYFETNTAEDYINVLFDLIQANLVEKVVE